MEDAPCMYRPNSDNAQVPNNPAAPFDVWAPFMAGALRWNVRTHEMFTSVMGEWQSFVGRRLGEDVALMQRLMCSRTRDQVLTAYVDFWGKAVGDYGKELTTLTNLTTRVPSEMVTAGQPRTDDAGSVDFSWKKAA
jgi:hypothetical protein